MQVMKDREMTNKTTLLNIANKVENGFSPSNDWINLEWGATLTTYTAPADGYFALEVVPAMYSTFVNMEIFTANDIYCYTTTIHSTHKGYNEADIIPVKKGNKLRIRYSDTCSVSFFKFIYANKEK